MNASSLLIPPMAATAGLAIGFAFGALQQAAIRRHEKLQSEGRFRSGWSATPGSFRRVAYLMVALALVQLVFPAFFAGGGVSEWLVSAGVVGGYGWTLYRQMRLRKA